MEITKYTHVGKGNLIGFASVTIKKWDFYINGIGICEKNGHRWINFPNRPYDAPDGTKKYAPHCGFLERDIKDIFEKRFLQALDEYLAKNPQQQQKEPDPGECPF
jgi:hypothetical protein